MTRQIRYIFFLLFCSLWHSSFTQNIVVPTLNFESTTRDTVVTFPDIDHNNYEKILMYYTMRCHDGLVSTTSNRNLGCREWDYSCNTYIVDSTRVDSVKASAPEYIVTGYSGDDFAFTDIPTFQYFQSTHKDVTYLDTISETEFTIFSGDSLDVYPFLENGQAGKFDYTFDIVKLNSLNIDTVTGMRLTAPSSSVTLSNLIIQFRHLSENQWETVYHNDVTISSEDSVIKFFNNLIWNQQEDVLFRISYDGCSESDYIPGFDVGAQTNIIYDLDDNNYVQFNGGGHIAYEEALPQISQEITVSFWSKGSDNLPLNTTIFESQDKDNRRQVNIHLPWGDQNVYWDCGNDGSGYDRISKAAPPNVYKNNWNHWAFTKNATTGEMKIFLNGNLWHSGSNFFKPIDMQKFKIGSSVNTTRFYTGEVENFRIWSKALDEAAIKSYMFEKIDDQSILEDLVLNMNFNSVLDLNGMVTDNSMNQLDLSISGFIGQRPWRSQDIFLDQTQTAYVPNLTLIKGQYDIAISDVLKLDSIANIPYFVEHYVVVNNERVIDLQSFLYQAGPQQITDEQGAIVGTINVTEQGVYNLTTLLDYYIKTPMAYEIMSFVTPYGIGVDFGLDGETWVFDVTEFGPILKGAKRMYLSRGGQWQEEMDIQFEFIEGIPERDVIDIEQIWRVDMVNNQDIRNDVRFEPVSLKYDPAIDKYMVKTAITGHGQEGEFIQRTHYINIGTFQDSWRAWKECGFNPVQPQGGTWVYDRAGWCPGMATDVRWFDITEFLQFLDSTTLDYTMDLASGDSRYIVNSQLIKYGTANKTVDAGIIDVLNPSERIEYAHFNPNCNAPEIVVRNSGSQVITELDIEYGINGTILGTENWTGIINFESSRNITLPLDLSAYNGGDEFFAKVILVGDEYQNNDVITSNIPQFDGYSKDVVIELRTNNAGQETSFSVTDSEGNVLVQRQGSLLNNTATYRDTLRNLNGCYNLLVSDSGSDGLSWWAAPNDGSGYLRIKSLDGDWFLFNPDFGAGINYNFSAGITTSVENLELIDVNIYPNPTTGMIHFSNLSSFNNRIHISVFDQLGQYVHGQYYNKEFLLNSNLNMLSEITPGVYTIHISDDQKQAIKKVVVAR